MKKDFLKALKAQILVCDGAMGTLLQQRANKLACPDQANLKYPELITSIHLEYVRAGADIIETNTFGANRMKLAEFSLENKIKEINQKGVRLAQKAAGESVYVAGSVGPLPDTVKPLGKLTFDQAYELFREQKGHLVEAGADLILLETFSYIKELKAAVIAAKTFDIPVQAHMTFEGGRRTLSGTTPEAFAVIMEGLGVDAIGTNCGAGPDDMLSILSKVASVTNIPLAIMPNAGLPIMKKGKTVFKSVPEDFRNFAQRAREAGAGIIGGCCGTSPGHIRVIKEVVDRKKPVKKKVPVSLKLASNTQVIMYQNNSFPLIIGERINPTARKALSQELKEGKLTIVKEDALLQTKNGADILDVNVSAGVQNEPELMEKVVTYIQKISERPLSIDTLNTETLEAGLKAAEGRPLINSVNAEAKSLEIVLPLAKKYGAALIALPITEKGIPDTARKRIMVIDKVLKNILQSGLKKEDVLFDCLTMAVSSAEGNPNDTLKTLELAKNRGLFTVLGVSNISYGMPNRNLINAAFLSMAVQHGLDAGIINPNNDQMTEALYGASLVSRRDPDGMRYIQRFGNQKMPVKPQEQTREKSIKEQLHDAILLGDRENIVPLLKDALKKGLKPLEIGLTILTPGLEEVGRKYEQKEYFLPQLIMAAETMQEASTFLQSQLDKNAEAIQEAGNIVMATVEGDVHDIGKNIVITVLRNYGFRIIDLGKNVSADRIIHEAKKHNADIIGLSALMTTTMTKIQEVIECIKKANLPFKTLIGGAVVSQEYANEIGADGYGKDAVQAVKVVKELMKRIRNKD